MTISAAQLRQLAPGAVLSIVDGFIGCETLLDDVGITTPIRIRHFMAQAATETWGLTRLDENLNYSIRSLCRTWPNKFPSASAAAPYANAPAKLAEKVYGGRYGNTAPGDGWKYRGSGLMQTTFKANFEAVEEQTGLKVVDAPDLLRAFPGALQAATIYWKIHSLNFLADRDDIIGITKAINGGTNGLADRKLYLNRARKIWA